MDGLITPLSYDFFVRTLLITSMAGLSCGVTGIFITNQRMSSVAYGLSHATLGGVVLNQAMGLHFYIGFGIWGLIAAVFVRRLVKRRIYSDGLITGVSIASLVLGVFLSIYRPLIQDIATAELYGRVLDFSPIDVWRVAAVTIVILGGAMLVCRPSLLHIDQKFITSHSTLLVVIEAIITLILATLLVRELAAMLGIIRIIPAVLIPAFTARFLSDRFNQILIISGGIGMATAFVGAYTSFYFNIALGLGETLANASVFVTVLLWKRSFQS